MPENYDVIVIFPIYRRFRAIRKPDSEHMVHNPYMFINDNLLSNSTWKKNYKFFNAALILLDGAKASFLIKNIGFLQKLLNTEW